MDSSNETFFQEYKNLKKHIVFYLIARLILAADGIIVWVPSLTLINGYFLLGTLYALRLFLYSWMFNKVYKKLLYINILKNSENRYIFLFLFFLIPGFFETALLLVLFSKSLRNFLRVRNFITAILLGAFLTYRFFSHTLYISHKIPEFVMYISPSDSSFIGQSFTLKVPMFILTNLRKEYDVNMTSTHVSTSALVKFKDESPSYLTTANSRLKLLPAGTVIEIIKSYNDISRGILFPRFNELFLIRTENGITAEIDKRFFEYYVIEAEPERFDYSEQPLVPLIQDFQTHGEKKLTICGSNSYGDYKLMFIEFRLLSLFKEYNLLNEVEIESVANVVDSSSIKKYCAIVNFKTLDPIYLMYFFDVHSKSGFVQNNLHKKFEIENVVGFDQEKALKMNEDEVLNFDR